MKRHFIFTILIIFISSSLFAQKKNIEPKTSTIKPVEYSQYELNVIKQLREAKKEGNKERSDNLLKNLKNITRNKRKNEIDHTRHWIDDPSVKIIYSNKDSHNSIYKMEWGGDINVTNDAESNQKAPSMTRSKNGDIYIAYEEYGDEYWEIVIRKSTDGGKTWNFLTGFTDFSQDFLFPDIAIGEGNQNKLYVTYYKKDSQSIGLFIYNLNDGKTSFKTISTSGENIRPRLCVDFDQNYWIYVAWIDKNSSSSDDLFFSRSTNYGDSFSDPEKLLGGVENNLDIGYGYGNLYIAFQTYHKPSEILLIKSTDFGNNWTDPIIISAESNNNLIYPRIAVSNFDNTACVTYSQVHNENDQDIFYTYTSDGQTWRYVFTIEASFDFESFADVYYMPFYSSGNNYHLSYYKNGKIYYRSTDHLGSWGTAIIISDQSNASKDDFTAVCADNNNNGLVSWAATSNGIYDIYFDSYISTTPIPNITVNYPNGGEFWITGTTYEITWDDNIDEDVKIQLYKNGSFDRNIASNTPSDGSYFWTVPYDLATNSDYQIKIESVNNYSVFDLSDSYFTICHGNIIVDSPNGGENWKRGTRHDITWTDNISENVKIELYKNGSYNSTIISSTPSDGSYSWLIPSDQATGTDYEIKITSVNDPSISDKSDSYFKIFGEITVTSPNGGENWQQGKKYNITWNDDISDNVKIELYKQGSYFTTITNSTPSDGSYQWTIPNDQTTGSNYKVKISDVSNPAIRDYSDNNFTISESGGHSVFPTSSLIAYYAFEKDFTDAKGSNNGTGYGGVKFGTGKIGQACNFDGNDDYVEMPSNPLGNIGSGSYTINFWFNPNNTLQYQSIVDLGENVTGSYDEFTNVGINSNAQLRGQGYFRDASNEIILKGGSVKKSNWQMATFLRDGNNWRLYLNNKLVDSGTNSNTYTSDLFNKKMVVSATTHTPPGSFFNGLVDELGIWNRALSESEISDLYNNGNGLSYVSEITITSPNGGENWQQGTTHTITWNDNISENVKIELLKNGSLNRTITSSTPSDGSYSWTIPSDQTIGSDYKIKITSVNNSSIFDQSDDFFTISEGTPGNPEFPSENLVAYYSFENGFNDDYSYNNGTGKGNIGFSEGKIGKGINLDGMDDYVEVPDTKELRLGSGSFSISCWFNASRFSERQRIIEKDQYNGQHDYVLYLDNNILKYESWKGDATGGNCTEGIKLQSSALSTNKWYHVVVTFDKSTQKVNLYLNNQLISSGTLGSECTCYDWPAAGGPQPLLFGRSHFNHSYFKGKIDEIALWNRTLTQQDIEKLYNDGNGLSYVSYINVTSPNGRENWQQGTTHTITWNDNISENVKIELFKGGGLNRTITSSTPSDGSYSWTIPSDQTVGTDYKIKITSVNNSSVFDESDNVFTINNTTGIEYDHNGNPVSFALLQNFPNPFNPSTTILFALPKTCFVILTLYNGNGEKIKTLIRKQMPAGLHQVKFEADNLPSGVYFYSIKAGKFKAVKKMLLIR